MKTSNKGYDTQSNANRKFESYRKMWCYVTSVSGKLASITSSKRLTRDEMSSTRLSFLFTDFEHIKYGMAFHALCRCHTVRFWVWSTLFHWLHNFITFSVYLLPGRKFYSQNFVIFSFANASNLIYISFPFYSSKWEFFFSLAFLFTYIKNAKLFLFFFLSFISHYKCWEM